MNIKYLISKKVLPMAAAVVFASVISGCASNSKLNGEGMKLPEGTWSLVEFSKDGELQSLEAVTLQIQQNLQDAVTVTGFAGVNNYGTTMSVKGNSLELDQGIISTKMAGPEKLMNFENAYLSALEKVECWAMEREDSEEVLVLSDKACSVVLKFQHQKLSGTAWRLVSIADSYPSISLYNQPELLFKADGEASLYTGINYIMIPYSADSSDESLEIFVYQGAMTLASGTDEETALEVQYMDALSNVASYSINGNELELRDVNGRTILVFEK